MSRRVRPVPLTPIEQQFNLKRWVEENVTIAEGTAPEYVAFCPKCGRPKLAVNTSIKAWHCLYAGCDFAGWHPVNLVRAINKCTLWQAEQEMAAYVLGARVGPLRFLEPDQPAERELPLGAFPPWTDLQPQQWRWLRERKVPDDFARWFGLRRIQTPLRRDVPWDWLLNERVLIPVYVDRRPVYWSARRLANAYGPKTVNMPKPCKEVHAHDADCTCNYEIKGLPRVPHAAYGSEVVLGLHLVSRGEPVIVVEGDMDAVTCGPGFVATLGAHVTPEQAALIARTGASEAIVLFDGDKAGDKARTKAVSEIGRYMDCRLATCPRGSDPGSLGRRRSLEIAHAAPRVGGIPHLRDSVRRVVPKGKGEPPVLRRLKES